MSKKIADDERLTLIAKLNAELKQGVEQLDRGEAIESSELARLLSETIERRRRSR